MTEKHFTDEYNTPNGPTPDEILQQLNNFKSGFPFTQITSAATLGNGITAQFDTPDYSTDDHEIVKFVPASGAATRMFRDLFEFLSSGQMNQTTQSVLDNLETFAFYSDLQKTLPENPSPYDIINHIVNAPGLDYGHLPKGLLKFHKYENENRTALEEHFAEGAQYAASNGIVNLHFTVSPEHIDKFNELITQLTDKYRSKFGLEYKVSLSTQKPETNTIAVNPDNTVFYDDNGQPVFRPAGHGALIENLNDIDADIIFIKNIDNVCPDNKRADTIRTKRQLMNVGLFIQKKIFDYIHAIDNNTANTDEIAEFIKTYLGYHPSTNADLRSILNRPLRVCGMVANTGAPGGGPFWTLDSNGNESLQIVESSQISPSQQDILTQGQYFNPVDLVCFVRDFKGDKFDLRKFIDPNTGFISEKSYQGRPIRAMERPGLWNGAMAHWNTVFIETPQSTFTPAKTISDLIKPQHQ